MVFGRLTVISRVDDHITPSGYHRIMWLCHCECGNDTIVASQELRNGDTKSCGCYERECKTKRATTHGLSKTRLHSVWKGMLARCYNKNHKNYNDYGGRGISVCNEWQTDFKSFYDWAVLSDYNDKLTLERKNVNESYCPDNCCWVDRVAQANNRRNNIIISYNGEAHNLKWWSDYTGIYYGTLYNRIKNGWDISKALNK